MVRRYSKKASKTVKGAMKRLKRGTLKSGRGARPSGAANKRLPSGFQRRGEKGKKFQPGKGRQEEIKRSRVPAGHETETVLARSPPGAIDAALGAVKIAFSDADRASRAAWRRRRRGIDLARATNAAPASSERVNGVSANPRASPLSLAKSASSAARVRQWRVQQWLAALREQAIEGHERRRRLQRQAPDTAFGRMQASV